MATGVRSRPPEDPTRTGIVTFFNTTKGFGFITDDNGKDSVFFHSNDLQQMVKEKDKVTFFRERTPKGYSAREVKRVD